MLFFFPACSALVVGALYWTGLRARADVATAEPWRKWGTSLALGYCGGLLLLQAVLIVGSLGKALYHLSASTPGDSRKMVKALTWRIGLSVGLFLLLIVAYYNGWITPQAGR